MTSIRKLDELGQSLWYDNIQRSQLKNGEMKRMVDQQLIKGVTSNPSIFQKSISSSSDYDETLKPMAWSGLDSESVFWQLAIEDIRKAADILHPVYLSSQRKDGFVSLEVSPYLARDTQKTIEQAKKLWERVDRENLMIKIPATKEGVPAIRAAIAHGINVNVTLIFSLVRYEEVMDAYLGGLEERLAQGRSIDQIASVASFFVSRVDTKVDGYLARLVESGKLSKQVYNSLAGHAAIANARLAYAAYEHVFNGERYKNLTKNGAQLQRPLWASTSTKNPDYRDVMYVEQLIGPDTVTTVPPNTLSAFLDHGIAEMTIGRDLDQARVLFSQLSSHGIEIGTVAEELEIEGVKVFADAFTELIHSIEVRKESAKNEVGKFLPNLADQVSHLKSEKFIERFFNKDATLWTSDQNAYDEIHNRMNWVKAPVENQKMIPELENFRKECLESGITKAVVLGMGVSSLAPEVFSLMHSSTTGDLQGLEISILDSTDPEQVALTREKSPVTKTLFIVASKSGTTGEINAFSEYFWQLAQNELGKDAGQHFVAITDPGSPLEKLAKERGYRTVFAGDPKVGGRYSALTAFGLVPASLIGMDLRQLLNRAAWMAELSGMQQMQEANPGLVLGAYIGNGAIKGRNKLTILTDQEWGPFANWLEQLIAESSGKIGKGITPVVNEPEMDASDYRNDRLFVYLRSAGQKDEFTNNLREVGQPVLTLQVGNEYDLGSQFYLWEVATPVACSIIGVNVFNQPDVQDAKTRTLNSIVAYKKDGRLTEPEPNRIIENTRIYSNRHFNHKENDTILDVIGAFCRENVRTGDYIGINAFLPMTKDVGVALDKLRERLLQQEKIATMLGYGPRFLHSTGQLHKGGPDEGIFIIITARRSKDLDIPGEGISFGVMQRAQAIGDMDALEARGRRIIWIDLPDIQESLSNLN